MDCKDTQRKLALYLSGGLSEKDRRRAQGHLDACERCREELRLYRESYDVLDSIEDVRPSEGFQRGLRSRLRRAQAAGGEKGHVWLKRAAAAACVAIVFGLLFHFWPRPQTAPRSETTGLTAEEEREILENLALLENFETLETAENGDMKMYAGEKFAAAEVLTESNIDASEISKIVSAAGGSQDTGPGAPRE